MDQIELQTSGIFNPDNMAGDELPEVKPENFDKIRAKLEEKAFVGHGGEEFKINIGLSENVELSQKLNLAVVVDLERVNFVYYKSAIANELLQVAESNIEGVQNIIDNPSDYSADVVEEAKEMKIVFDDISSNTDSLNAYVDDILDASKDYIKTSNVIEETYSQEAYKSQVSKAKDYLAYQISQLPDHVQNNILYSDNYQLETYLNDNPSAYAEGELTHKNNLLQEGDAFTKRSIQSGNIFFRQFSNTQAFLHEFAHHNDFGLTVFNQYVFEDLSAKPSSNSSWSLAVDGYVNSQEGQASEIYKNHLQRGYEASAYNIEVQAEVERIYLDAYVQSEGNFQEVDKAMNGQFGDLWSSYKENFLPEYDRYYTPEVIRALNDLNPVSREDIKGVSFEYRINSITYTDNSFALNVSELSLEEQILLKKFMKENSVHSTQVNDLGEGGKFVYFSKNNESKILSFLDITPESITYSNEYYDFENNKSLGQLRSETPNTDIEIKNVRTGDVVIIPAEIDSRSVKKSGKNYLGATAIGIPASVLAGGENSVALFGFDNDALVNLNNVGSNVRSATQSVVQVVKVGYDNTKAFLNTRSQTGAIAGGSAASAAMLGVTLMNYGKMQQLNEFNQSFGGERAKASRTANDLIKTDLAIGLANLADDAVRLSPAIASGLTNLALRGTGLSTTGDDFFNAIASSERGARLLSNAGRVSTTVKVLGIAGVGLGYAAGQYMENISAEAQDGHGEMKAQGSKVWGTVAGVGMLVTGIVLAPVTLGGSLAIAGAGIAVGVGASYAGGEIYDNLWGDEKHNEYVKQNEEKLKKCTDVIGGISCKMNENFIIGAELSQASQTLDEALLNGNQENIQEALVKFNQAKDGIKDIQLLSPQEVGDLTRQKDFLKEQARNVATWQTERGENGEIIDEGQKKILENIQKQLETVEYALAFNELSKEHYFEYNYEKGEPEFSKEYQERLDFANEIAVQRIEQLNKIDARDEFKSFVKDANQQLAEHQVSTEDLKREDILRTTLYKTIEDNSVSETSLGNAVVKLNEIREAEQQDIDALVARKEKIAELIANQEELASDQYYGKYAKEAIEELKKQEEAISKTIEIYSDVNGATDQTLSLANETIEIKNQLLDDEEVTLLIDNIHFQTEKTGEVIRQSLKNDLDPNQAIYNNLYLEELEKTNNELIDQYSQTIQRLKQVQAEVPKILQDEYQTVIDQQQALLNRFTSLNDDKIETAKEVIAKEMTERVIQFPDQDAITVLAQDGSLASYSVNGNVVIPSEGNKFYVGDLGGDFINTSQEAQTKEDLVIISYDESGEAIITNIGQELRGDQAQSDAYLDKLKGDRKKLKEEDGINYRQDIKKPMQEIEEAYDKREGEFDPVQEAAEGLIKSGAIVALDESYNQAVGVEEEKVRGV